MKTTHLTHILIFIALSLIISSCWFLGPSVRGNGEVKAEERPTGKFDQIKVERGMNVYITQGSPAKVVVIADSNLHEIIETRLHGNELLVSAFENIKWAKEKKVVITVENITAIRCSSGSNLYSENKFDAESLDIRSSSGANVKFEMNAKNLVADASSGANIYLSGNAEEADLEVSSGANIKSPDLITINCKMRASSGGNISAFVKGKLQAKASSGGNATYYGTPETTSIEKSSGGNVFSRQ